MRHWVNFGLLLSFGTLLVTGILSFVRPFSLVTTRLHVVFGLATAALVGLHLVARWKYFRAQLSSPKKRSTANRTPWWQLSSIVLVWLMLLAVAISDAAPVAWLIEQGYESRHRKEIVRSGSSTGFLGQPGQVMVSRKPGGSGAADGAQLSLRVELSDKTGPVPAMAVWTETTAGAMIETLYLDPRLAYAEQVTWGGQPAQRKDILPLWRHRYTLLSGIDPTGEVDVFTGATAEHSFSLDDYLDLGQGNQFVVCVELNQPGDVTEKFPDPVLGQPSVLYTALVEIDQGQTYDILRLTGHGGEAQDSGAIRYDLDVLDSASRLVEFMLLRVSKPTAEE